MRKSALAASTLAAVGLMAAGGTAFASTGGHSEASKDGEDTNRAPVTQQEAAVPHATNTQIGSDAGRSVVGLNVPVAAANGVNVQDVARDVVHVGRTQVPAVVHDVVTAPVASNTSHARNATKDASTAKDADTDKDADADSGNAATKQPAKSTANASTNSGNGVATASAVNVGDTVNNVVATATATVNGVTNLASVGGSSHVQADS